MKELLQSFNLSEDAINIYLKCLGKLPYTFSEIQNIVPNLSEKEVREILDELIEKNLILLVKPKYSESVSHYMIIPPFAAIIDSLSNLVKASDEPEAKELESESRIEKFQETLYQDIEKISEDLIELLSKKGQSNQVMEILSEVEVNVKKLAQLILNDVIGIISPLKMQSSIDARDLNKLLATMNEKISESEEMVANMFKQFRDIVKNMDSSEITAEIEAFKTFIRNLGESINKRVDELSLSAGTPALDKIQSLEKSLDHLLTTYISMNTEPMEKFWIINSHEKIKEILSILLENAVKEMTIIVPNVEDFIPLEKFDLDYEESISIKQNTSQKKQLSTKPSISKKQRVEFEEKLDLTAKKVAERKGYELSHDMADILALVSEINAESAILDSIQGWLNRLLVIRKHLDSNTQYLLLDALTKWKTDFLKVKKVTEKIEYKEAVEMKSGTSEGKSMEKNQPEVVNITIIASDPHENKHALAFSKKANIEYLQLEKNDLIVIIADQSSLIFGIYQKTSKKIAAQITGFFTTYRPIIETILPLILEIRGKARYRKEIEINRRFNEIIENINDYSGKKIARKLETLLDIVFEKDGISLDILELKLLVGKLEKIHINLDNEMKQHVVTELNSLNKKFSSIELISPPEFRPAISKEEPKGDLDKIITLTEIEPLDPEKLDNLFELFIEKIADLKGVEIGEELNKLIDTVLKLQGYSNIIEWKTTLSGVSKTLEEPFKEKIKEDLLSWKLGILRQTSLIPTSINEESAETHEYLKQESASSIFEEEYISPGLEQSQFGAEIESFSTDQEIKIDQKTEMRDLFNKIQTELGDLTGIEISKIMQDIVDIILETN
ncbi:MAG: hypothetical protein ACFFDF_10755, partial [Candidatus Odinarchaeota archaeon]